MRQHLLSDRKISTEEFDIFRKRRIQFLNWNVASKVEEFDCGNLVMSMEDGKADFGISKLDFLVSSRYTLNAMMNAVTGGNNHDS